MNKNKNRFLKFLIIFFCIFGLSLALYHTLMNVSPDRHAVTGQPSTDSTLNTAVSEALVQAWNVSWGEADTNDAANGLVLDSAGNIYVVGSTNSYGIGTPSCSNIFLIKFFANGTKAWNVTWGGTAIDQAGDVELDSAGNIYITGLTYSFGPGTPSQPNLVLLKYYSDGTKAWNVTWGGSASTDVGVSLTLNSSGIIYVTGYTNITGSALPDLALLQFLPTGALAWNVTWGNSLNDAGSKVALDLAGKIYVVGGSQNPHDTNLVLVKFDPNSTRIWNVTWGGSGQDFGFSLTIDSAGNIYTVGQTDILSPDFSSNLALVKFASNGTRLWNISWGGALSQSGLGIAQDPDDNLYVCGSNSSELLLVKFAPDGEQLGNNTWGRGGRAVRGMDIAINSSERIYICSMLGTGGPMGGYFQVLLGKFIFSKIPAAPSNPIPSNGAIVLSTNPLLSVYVSDPDNLQLNVSFYNATSKNLIGTAINVANGSRASLSWLGLSGRKTYSWYAVVSDGASRVRSATWSFTTNNPPTASNPLPVNGSGIYSLTATLQVYVEDLDGDTMDVSFYKATDDSLIGIATNVISGTTASTSWGGLTWGVRYTWYVNVTDGTNTTKSLNWTFHPNRAPNSPINPSPVLYARKIGNSTMLTVLVSDPDGDAMDVSFYNASTNTLIGTAMNVLSGDNASIIWSSLAWGTRYYWYAVADDGFNETRSLGQWTFWTNFAPYFRIVSWDSWGFPGYYGIASPPDGYEYSAGGYFNLHLTVAMGDDDFDNVNVSFYNAADNSLIYKAINERTEPTYGFAHGYIDHMESGESLSWYCVVTDGNSTTVSPVWTFSIAPNQVQGWSICIILPPIVAITIYFYLRDKTRTAKELVKI